MQTTSRVISFYIHYSSGPNDLCCHLKNINLQADEKTVITDLYKDVVEVFLIQNPSLFVHAVQFTADAVAVLEGRKIISFL